MKPRGARRWGDDHMVGRARDRRGADAVVKPHSHPDDRPDCPRCGASGTRINKAGKQKGGAKDGMQRWLCFACSKRFYDPAAIREWEASQPCPNCGSDRIEQEHDGTWVCWNCSWYRRTT